MHHASPYWLRMMVQEASPTPTTHTPPICDAPHTNACASPSTRKPKQAARKSRTRLSPEWRLSTPILTHGLGRVRRGELHMAQQGRGGSHRRPDQLVAVEPEYIQPTAPKPVHWQGLSLHHGMHPPATRRPLPARLGAPPAKQPAAKRPSGPVKSSSVEQRNCPRELTQWTSKQVVCQQQMHADTQDIASLQYSHP